MRSGREGTEGACWFSAPQASRPPGQRHAGDALGRRTELAERTALQRFSWLGQKNVSRPTESRKRSGLDPARSGTPLKLLPTTLEAILWVDTTTTPSRERTPGCRLLRLCVGRRQGTETCHALSFSV
jgi:hypothetical protein